MNDKITQAIQTLTSNSFSHEIIPSGKKQDTTPVVKTIVFKDARNEIFAVAVLLQDRVSYKKIRQIRDAKVSTLHPDALESLGWLPGECCPLTIQGPLYIDESVMGNELIQSGSGDINFRLKYPLQAISSLRSDVYVVDVRE